MSIAQYVVLSNGQMVQVPEGADPDAFRKVQEAGLRLKANPKRRKRRERRGTPKKRINYAESVLWMRNGLVEGVL